MNGDELDSEFDRIIAEIDRKLAQRRWRREMAGRGQRVELAEVIPLQAAT